METAHLTSIAALARFTAMMRNSHYRIQVVWIWKTFRWKSTCRRVPLGVMVDEEKIYGAGQLRNNALKYSPTNAKLW
jgi:hypothetical protein